MRKKNEHSEEYNKGYRVGYNTGYANYWEEKSKHLTPPPVPCCADTRKKVKRNDMRLLGRNVSIFTCCIEHKM